MSRRTILLGMAAAVALLAGCTAAGSSEPPCEVNCYGAEAAQQRTLSVTGEGKVTVTPDIAVSYLSVISRDPSLSAAWDDNNARTAAVIAALQGKGVAAEDIRSNFNVNQQEEYDRSGLLTGKITYIVTHSLTVTIRDLEKVGGLLGAAQAAGVDTIGGVAFALEDPAAAIREARALAVANARERAEELAAGLGVTVGKVITINEYGGSIPYPADRDYATGVGGGGSSVPISVGTWEVSLSVGVVFEIE
ncbi:MAG: SIMPL domain-containing protein [Anaerolineales bacterium]